MLHIRTVATNHAIKANIPDFRRHLSLAAAGTDIDQMTLFPCLANGDHSRLRYMIVIVDDGTVHIKKDDFSRHNAPFFLFFSWHLLNAFFIFYKFSHSDPALFYKSFILLYTFLKAFSYRIIRYNGTILFSHKKQEGQLLISLFLLLFLFLILSTHPLLQTARVWNQSHS